MFVVAPNAEFTHTVEVQTPVDGGFRKESFKARFKLMNSDLNGHDVSTDAGSTEWLRDLVTHLDEVTDQAGQPVPYSDELREQVIRMPHARAALTRTYFAAIRKEAGGN